MLILAMCLSVVLSISIFGCKKETTVTDEEQGETSVFVPPTNEEMLKTMPEELVGEKDSFKGIKIGFSQRAIAGATWYENLVRVAKLEAEHLGAEIIVVDAQSDISKQITDIETLLAQEIDVLLVNPFDSKGILPAIESAHKANIPVVAVNCEIDPAGSPFSFVGHGIYDFGYSAGFAFAKEVDSILGNKEVFNAAAMRGFPGEDYSTQEINGIIAGFMQYFLTIYDKINLNIVAQKYGEWSADVALPLMADVLSANPEVDLLFTCDGQMLMGSIRAIEDAGRIGDILIQTAGGRKEELKLILDGDKGVITTVMADPRDEAKWAVLLACHAAKGNAVPAVFNIPALAITKDNVEQFYDPDSQY